MRGRSTIESARPEVEPLNPVSGEIVVNLDRVMLERRMSLTELSEKTGISMTNLSVLKTRKARLVRFSTLDAICTALDCQPGDILEHRPAA